MGNRDIARMRNGGDGESLDETIAFFRPSALLARSASWRLVAPHHVWQAIFEAESLHAGRLSDGRPPAVVDSDLVPLRLGHASIAVQISCPPRNVTGRGQHGEPCDCQETK
jgi:hypothetical protein